MLIQEGLSLQKKLEILTDAAKYDVACTSSGADRRGQAGALGNAAACGICHTFSADGRCVSLLKILLTNECIYDCRYCINRISNDTVRTAFTPEEICTLTMEFYRRNYIEGLFLSSGVLRSPDYTMDLICQTLQLLRDVYHFRGYIHVKGIPGADPALIEKVGHLADRMSVNLELPTGEGLRRLAPAKTRERILAPMRQIRDGIAEQTLLLEDRASAGHTFLLPRAAGDAADTRLLRSAPAAAGLPAVSGGKGYESTSRFVPAGQSTQMIIGATPETDLQLMQVTSALYQRFKMKRVFYSAYTALNDDTALPPIGTKPPLLREHRLYQADWLLRYYGFQADELLTEERPYFNQSLDPKCEWAIRHIELFPVEVNRADYYTLLRVPGLGVRSAKRILKARRSAKLDFPDLKKLGVVLKRAAYFITCSGRMLHPTKLEEDYLTSMLSADDRLKNAAIADGGGQRQLSLFEDFGLTTEDPVKSISGEL